MESPIGWLSSNAMRACAPLPMRPSTKLPRISLQPRMQRSHRMQASSATAMASEESSRAARAAARAGSAARRRLPACASVSSSQSPECCCRAQGDGWSDISSSTQRAARARARGRNSW